MAETYRSYVVRVRRPAVATEAVQIDVEDLIGGGRVAVNGDEARSLAERLRSLIVDAHAVVADPAEGPVGGIRRASRPSERRSR